MEKKPNKTKKGCIITIILLALSPFLICGGCLLADSIKTFIIEYKSPEPEFIALEMPVLLLELPDDNRGFRWNDNNSITIGTSNWTKEFPEAPPTMTEYHMDTGEFFNYEGTYEASTDLPDYIISEKLVYDWVACPGKDLIATVGGRDDWPLWVAIYKGDEMLQTYPFTSEQWYERDKNPFLTPEFSPSCDYLTVNLFGWVAHEAYGKEELWLLDIHNKTFERIILGNMPHFTVPDYSVQDVSPSWSPDETQFIFGSGSFGLERYDIATGTETYFASPKFHTRDPEWSPNGKWVAAYDPSADPQKLYIFSADESVYSYIESCGQIWGYDWSPDSKSILFSCTAECENQCPDANLALCINQFGGPCKYERYLSDYFYVWDVE